MKIHSMPEFDALLSNIRMFPKMSLSERAECLGWKMLSGEPYKVKAHRYISIFRETGLVRKSMYGNIVRLTRLGEECESRFRTSEHQF